MNFTIVREMHIDNHQARENRVNYKVAALRDCLKGVEKLCARWYSLGAINRGEPRVKVKDTLENYDASSVSVCQQVSIKFFDLLHAARQGRVQISKRQQDEDGLEFRTFSVTKGG